MYDVYSEELARQYSGGLQELFQETNDKFSEALHLYAKRLRSEFYQQFKTFMVIWRHC